ncbi:unnamed protein product [Taenia asiatica]|uniref:Non-specific protein-tyrosine kinase n=1 Tax=Taenia asiatica TaxID=60517 RepID=A0A0R3VWN3_TAEAS|nr:unnamed protein product [Taenia asiatica]
MVYLEEKRVVHRDLRAANVRVDADGSVKVADFGLAKILGSGRNSTEGTFPIRWTAPEAMVEGYEPSTKADVWSFGVLMFEILTYGKMPYEEAAAQRDNIVVAYLVSLHSAKMALKKYLTVRIDEAFRDEAVVMHLLSHPHVVHFLGRVLVTTSGDAA